MAGKQAQSALLAALRMRLTAISMGLLGAAVPTAQARPVSYVDGVTVMTESRASQDEAMVDYTFDRHAAVGVHAGTYRSSRSGSPDEFVSSPLLTVLPLRWNADGRQANLYIGGGYGAVWAASKTTAAGTKPQGRPLAIVDADAESRTYYASLRHEQLTGVLGEDLSYSRCRLGLSPYQPEFGSLHIWMVAQVDYSHWQRTTEVTPMARFFFQNFLWELGVSVQGHAQFNWTAEL